MTPTEKLVTNLLTKYPDDTELKDLVNLLELHIEITSTFLEPNEEDLAKITQLLEAVIAIMIKYEEEDINEDNN